MDLLRDGVWCTPHSSMADSAATLSPITRCTCIAVVSAWNPRIQAHTATHKPRTRLIHSSDSKNSTIAKSPTMAIAAPAIHEVCFAIPDVNPNIHGDRNKNTPRATFITSMNAAFLHFCWTMETSLFIKRHATTASAVTILPYHQRSGCEWVPATSRLNPPNRIATQEATLRCSPALRMRLIPPFWISSSIFQTLKGVLLSIELAGRRRSAVRRLQMKPTKPRPRICFVGQIRRARLKRQICPNLSQLA